MPLSQAFILLRQDDVPEFKVAAAFYGTPNKTKSHITVMPIEDTLSGFVHTHRRSLRIDDLKSEKRFPEVPNYGRVPMARSVAISAHPTVTNYGLSSPPRSFG